LQLQEKAQATARYEVTKGTLPKITKDTKCFYCGDEALGYDHRDYRKYLDVKPVCRKCNLTLPRALPEFKDDIATKTEINASCVGGDEVIELNNHLAISLDITNIDDHLEYCEVFPRRAFKDLHGVGDYLDGVLFVKRDLRKVEDHKYPFYLEALPRGD